MGLSGGIHADQIGGEGDESAITRLEVFVRIAVVHAVNIAVIASLFPFGGARLQRRLLPAALDHLFVLRRQIVGRNVDVVAVIRTGSTSLFLTESKNGRRGGRFNSRIVLN